MVFKGLIHNWVWKLIYGLRLYITRYRYDVECNVRLLTSHRQSSKNLQLPLFSPLCLRWPHYPVGETSYRQHQHHYNNFSLTFSSNTVQLSQWNPVYCIRLPIQIKLNRQNIELIKIITTGRSITV